MKNASIRGSVSVLVGIVVTALLGSGCHVATSTQPIGATPLATGQNPLDGIWSSGDGQPFFVRTVDSAAGRLEVANVVTDQNGFRLERQEVLLRKHGDATFANLRSHDPGPDENFTFGRLTLQDHTLVLTLAPTKALRRLVLEGAIEASLTTNQGSDGISYSVVVTNGFDRLADRLATPEGWQWFDLENPIVLTRQKAGLN